MSQTLTRIASVFACLTAFATNGLAPSCADSTSRYTPWGVDEYQLFGLKKQELETKFKEKLFFSKDFARATLSRTGTGLGYQGAVFNLSFTKERVSSVQGVFEGCTQNYSRPRFDSKEAALNYAIDGLSSCSGADEKKSLAQAKQVLAELKRSSGQGDNAHSRL